MIDLDPTSSMSVYDDVAIKDYIAGLFDGPVDIVRRDGLKAHIAPTSTCEAIHAF